MGLRDALRKLHESPAAVKGDLMLQAKVQELQARAGSDEELEALIEAELVGQPLAQDMTTEQIMDLVRIGRGYNPQEFRQLEGR